MRCPSCRKEGVGRDGNGAFPFCSERCRLIDLGNWLGEAYRVPLAEEDDAIDDDGSPEAVRLEAVSTSARRGTRTS